MKSKFLSILPSAQGLPSAPEENSAAASANQTAEADNLARYYAFLNQQIHQSPQRSNSLSGVVRLAQGLLSFAVFVAMFLTILTLFGLGLSRLGVIAQVTNGTNSVSGKNSSSAVTDSSPSSDAPKRKSRHK